MSKHTPGPWHWDSDPIKGDPLGRMRYRVTTIGKTITQCYYSSADEQAEWDARLIAAAPELLEALQTMVARIEYYTNMGKLSQPNIEQWEYVEGSSDMANARAAIAKATGEK